MKTEVTHLVWRKRTAKPRRLTVTKTIRRFYPDVIDTGAALRFTHDRDDSKPLWLFMLADAFTDIR